MMTRLLNFRCAVAVLLAVLLTACASAGAATVTVTNTLNSGTGSLRAAITAANAAPGTTIAFNIPGTAPGGVWTIRPSYALPSITANGTVLDASTQTAVRNSNTVGPEVEIDFSLLDVSDSYLRVQGSNCTIRGLVLNHHTYYSVYGAIDVTGSSTRVAGCYIGTDSTGQVTFASGSTVYGGVGIQINAGSNSNIIGGTSTADRNVIASGPGSNTRFCGISLIRSNDNLIQGNYIGINATGTAILGIRRADDVVDR